MQFGSIGHIAFMAAAVFICLVGRHAAAAERQTLDSIVAIVNDDIVLMSEYEDRLAEWMPRLSESDEEQSAPGQHTA